MSLDARPYDHLRPRGDVSLPDGTYRVVGAGAEVTLLRVTDADGRRANTGEVVHLSRDTLAESFEPAENPDSGLSPSDFLPPLDEYATAIRYWLPF